MRVDAARALSRCGNRNLDDHQSQVRAARVFEPVCTARAVHHHMARAYCELSAVQYHLALSGDDDVHLLVVLTVRMNPNVASYWNNSEIDKVDRCLPPRFHNAT